MYTTNLVMDFGGTFIKTAIMRNGKILSRQNIPNNLDISDLDRAAEMAFGLCSKAGIAPENLGGVGLSFPGIVDTDAKTILSINEKYTHIVGLDLGEWVQRTFALPSVADNDARLALLGETGYGVAKGSSNVVGMILGTGIGTAAMIDGKLLRGAHYQAGILGGHITIETGGYRCNCGNRGCVEAEAGSWNMPAIARNHPDFDKSLLSQASVLDFKAISDAHRAGDRVASDILARLVRCWAICIVNLIHAYDPEIVVLSGGLMKSHDLILPALREYVTDHAWTPSKTPEIRIAADSNVSPLMGLDYMINLIKK